MRSCNDSAELPGTIGLTPDLFAALATVFLQLSETEAARLEPEQVDADAGLDDVLASIDGEAEAG